MIIKVKPFFVRIITFGFASAITLYPFGIFLRSKLYLNYYDVLNHERIHWAQQREMFCIFFYLWYFIEWIVRGFGYYSISFEREAYSNQKDMEYLKKRKRFAWIGYLNAK